MGGKKITAGVKMGMSPGMSAHHSWGFAVRKTTAMLMAHTKQIRMAILRAQVGSVCMQIDPRTVLFERLSPLHAAVKW
jgi:hypothetical protein